MEEKMQFAILIDAENVSARYAPVIFDELEKYGFASCRRIYGDWSKENGWGKNILLEYSVTPIQQFTYTQGKNSTDVVMVIDAMDLLYQNKVDGFCLVTSDCDFMRLAMRVREEKKYVLGMGESKTPLSLIRACNKFAHLDLIGESHEDTNNYVALPNYSEENEIVSEADENADNSVTSIDDVKKVILAMLNEAGSEGLELARVGQRLSDKFPDFDVRNYGYSKLSVFLTQEMPPSVLVTRPENGHHRIYKMEEIPCEKIEQEIIAIIRANGGSIDNLGIISNELKKRYDGFDLKNYGYSKISRFLRSIKWLSVNGNVVRLKS